jgi:cytochrome P450
MDSATEFLFGKSTNILDPAHEMKSAREFVEAFVYVTHEMPKDFQTGGLNKWLPRRKFWRSVKIIHAFADELVQDAIERHRSKNDLEKDSMKASDTKQRYIFLDELLKQTQDPYTLRSELLNVLLAGRDTTAGLVSFSTLPEPVLTFAFLPSSTNTS